MEGPGENHQPVASHWQTLSHNVVQIALSEIQTCNISGDGHWLHIGSCKSHYHTITPPPLLIIQFPTAMQILSLLLVLIKTWLAWNQDYLGTVAIIRIRIILMRVRQKSLVTKFCGRKRDNTKWKLFSERQAKFLWLITRDQEMLVSSINFSSRSARKEQK